MKPGTDMQPPPAPGVLSDPRPLFAGGHLARLVQRACLGEAVLQRRRPAMFEPGHPAGLLMHGDVDAVAHAVPTPSTPRPYGGELVEATRSRPADGGAAAPVPPPAAARAIERPSLRALRDLLRVDASLHARPPGLHPPATGGAQEVSPRALGGNPAAQTHPAARAPAQRPPAGVEPVAIRDAQRQRATPVAPPLHSGRELASVSPRPAQAREHSTSHRAPAVPPAPLRRVAVPAAQRTAAAPPTLAASRPALPPVQVTIGRIEVRAVTAPAPAAERRARAAPRLSLEHYLHARQRGER